MNCNTNSVLKKEMQIELQSKFCFEKEMQMQIELQNKFCFEKGNANAN